jgi:hypothetical protein
MGGIMNGIIPVEHKDNWNIAKDISELPEYKKISSYHGYLYVVEYGNAIKIGRTKKLVQRVKQLKTGANCYSDKKIGRIAYSIAHTNYLKNEHEIHKCFQNKRIGNGELFDITLEEFFSQLPPIEFRDDSAELEAKGAESIELLKNLLFGGL